MDRIRRLISRDQPYEPLDDGSERPDPARIQQEDDGREPFSWMDYSVFLLLGVAMLWAWNMFLAAGPYFRSRLESNKSILHAFQPAQLSASTIVNLSTMLVLAKLQSGASYPKRTMAALLINMVTFSLLAISTRHLLGASADVYFGFVIVMVAVTSFGTALCQNGVFAYVSGFAREEYTQAIMVGQGVAGVLPSVAQIASVLSVATNGLDGQDVSKESSRSAFAYFMTATVISAFTLFAFLSLLLKHASRNDTKSLADSIRGLRSAATGPSRDSVSLLTLLRKLFWLAAAVFLTFAISMVFPVFTQEIKSVRPLSPALPRIFQPACFIPLAFLFWNTGDLVGRILPGVSAFSLTAHPKLVFALSASRIVFIPVYLLCNIGHGPAIDSDAFYLAVQMLFGFTNGFLGSTCMMGAVEWVDMEEREAAGAFMGLCLVAGLTVGSLASFAVVGALV